MRPWVHPTGNRPERVLLCCLGPSKSALIDAQTAHLPPPLLMDVDEVWGLNAAHNWFAGRVRWDCLFVLDHLDGEQAKYPAYISRLLAWSDRHQAPIITSEAGAYGEHVQIHEYPLREIISAAPESTHLYLHNSLPLILAYADFIGVKELVLYGADYSHQSHRSREADRPCAEYWIGWCAARGMLVRVPTESSLLNQDQPPHIYGYPRYPSERLQGLVQ